MAPVAALVHTRHQEIQRSDQHVLISNHLLYLLTHSLWRPHEFHDPHKFMAIKAIQTSNICHRVHHMVTRICRFHRLNSITNSITVYLHLVLHHSQPKELLPGLPLQLAEKLKINATG